jgi:Caspase domain
MNLRSLFIVLSLFFGSSVYAQSFFEMYFHFGNETKPEEITKYGAFYLLNDDGTGMMRISYKGATPAESFIIECDLIQGFAQDDKKNIDYSKMYYTGNNFQYIGQADTAAAFPPISFWFIYNPTYDVYDPWAVMTKDEQDKNLQGVIDDMRLLEDKDFTRELVLSYFTKNEEIYENLFTTNNTRAPLTNELKSSRMFLLTVADTEDGTIGPDCDTDRKKQQEYFKKIADKLGIQIIITELLGKDLSKTNVLKKIDEIQPTRNDIVIFHYSGHGYSKEDNRQYPYLDLRYDKDIPVKNGDELNMEEIYAMITNKPGRLNLVISDCCNWHLDVTSIRSQNIATPRPSSVGLSLDNMKALFMSPNRTSIMITAAAKGQVSAGNPINGGIFTTQFRESLQKFMSITNENITWDQITQNTKTQTDYMAGLTLCPKPENPSQYSSCKQTPVFKMN